MPSTIPQEEISRVLMILKKKTKNFENPIVTEIGNKTSNQFHVLISCMLSLRTRDETTGKISAKLFEKANTPEEILGLGKDLEKIIRPVNYYKTKAKRIRETCKILVKKYNGKVPGTLEELLDLPGVGRKTANIVIVYGFNKMGIPVDTHVHRISNRLGWVNTKLPDKTEMELRKIVPKRHWMSLNDIFVMYGQNICRPVNPKCDLCPATKYCSYYKNTPSTSKNRLKPKLTIHP
ncbi:MAG: endonuclease III [Candidatus Aenigmarchaeota archaeon]|nr:endonuclease III [Candidatus Aenigmarchaeota archaeon]